MAETIGVIGLGAMGAAMAGRLLEAGHALRLWNRTADKAKPLVQAGAASAASPAEAAGGGLVITMLADDQALEAVTSGHGGILAGLGEGGLHLSMSTIAPATARRLAKAHAERGAVYLAAPVFGRPEAAAAGKLWVLLSGPGAARERARPVFDALAQGVFEFGDDPGAANVVKLAGNFLLLSAIEAMAEAFTFGEKNGIGREALSSLFGTTLFACPVYQNYGRAVAAQKPSAGGFRLALALKDVNLALDAAGESAVPMPLASLLRDRLLSSKARGGGDLDVSRLALEVSASAGLKPGA